MASRAAPRAPGATKSTLDKSPQRVQAGFRDFVLKLKARVVLPLSFSTRRLAKHQLQECAMRNELENTSRPSCMCRYFVIPVPFFFFPPVICNRSELPQVVEEEKGSSFIPLEIIEKHHYCHSF